MELENPDRARVAKFSSIVMKEIANELCPTKAKYSVIPPSKMEGLFLL
jgi:hypothetical protein